MAYYPLIIQTSKKKFEIMLERTIPADEREADKLYLTAHNATRLGEALIQGAKAAQDGNKFYLKFS